jgi:hypothetical protein
VATRQSGTLGFSFGHLIPDGGAVKRAGGGRRITELDVFEITATPVPVNNDTRVVGWKSVEADVEPDPALERFRHEVFNEVLGFMGATAASETLEEKAARTAREFAFRQAGRGRHLRLLTTTERLTSGRSG